MTLDSIARRGFTGNELKILAMITMTIDHIGMVLFPQFRLLRIIGRLAMPIYAYMIAEGCRHTRSRARYFFRVAAMAALCQVVYYIADGSLYQCILVTFSLSILVICAVENVQEKRSPISAVLAVVTLGAALFVCQLLPKLLPGTDFYVDYGFAGVLLPALVYFSQEKTKYLTVGLFLLGITYRGIQWWALAAVPLLGMYNGQRGKGSLGPVFYWYYPLHLAVIYGIGLTL